MPQHSTNSLPRGKRRASSAWPPRYLSPIPAAALKASRGDEVVDFAEALCKVTKDSVAGSYGSPLVFRDWQRDLTRHLFARDPKTGKQRHRTALVGLPRKNGKSAWLSSVVLEHLVLGPEGGEAYSCAADRDQAKIVFSAVKEMVKLQPELSDFLQVYRDAIYNPKTGSTYRALSSEAFTKEGLSPTFVAFDELHAQPNRELFDVMSLAQGARPEPLLVAITTAGVKTDSTGKYSVCYTLYEYGKKVASGEIDDPSFFFAWWEIDPTLDYRTPEAWRSGNPGFDDIVAAEDFESAIKRTPENEFKTKRGNIFTSNVDAWLPHGSWDAIAKQQELVEGERVVLAFDGSFNGDSTVIVAATVPEIADAPIHLAPVAVWEKPENAGPDWKVPVLDVEDAIRRACQTYNVLEIACDTYRWARSFEILEDDGLPVVKYPQTPQRMTPATARFYEAVMNHTLTHNGDPVLARHIANATLKTDSRGGSRLAKEDKSSTKRIDLAVCSVMALDRAAFYQQNGSDGPQIIDVWNMEVAGA